MRSEQHQFIQVFMQADPTYFDDQSTALVSAVKNQLGTDEASFADITML